MADALIVDDHPAIRLAVCARLERELGFHEILETDNGDEAFELVRQHVPPLLIVDLGIPRMSGIDLIERVGAAHPEVRMLVLSGQDEDLSCSRSMRAGAHGFVAKRQSLGELVSAVRSLLAGYSVFPLHALGAARQQGYASGRDALTLLTEREVTVLQYLAHGYSNKDIARELLISSKTVSTHKVNIMEKLHIGSLIELADFARHHNLLR